MSALSHKNRKQNLSTHSSLRALKFNTDRVLKAVGSPNHAQTFNDRQIAHQLMQEFGMIGQLLEECEARRKCCELPSSQLNDPIKSIINMQSVLSTKDKDIQCISEEIKALKSARGQQESSIKQQKQQQEVFQLASELKKERMELVEALQEHSRHVKKYQQMKEIIKKAEQRYHQKFSKSIMSYQEFKLHQEERREEPKRQRTSFRVETTIVEPSKAEGPLKTMRELQTKKAITEAAIKNSRKKHQQEVNELRAKIEFLRDQDTLLDQKMRQVQYDKGALEEKFKGSLRYIKSRITNLRGSPSFLKTLPL